MSRLSSRHRVLRVYAALASIFVVCVVGWFGLNKARVHYYNDVMEGRREQSPYWKVIAAQDVLQWPILGATASFALIAIYELARTLAHRIERKG